MSAGYVIAQLRVTNPENYKEYIETGIRNQYFKFYKKIILFLILLFFSFSNYSQAEIKEPGKINSLKCTIGALDAYIELQENLEKKPKHKGVVYLACDTSSGEYSWTWQLSLIHI